MTTVFKLSLPWPDSMQYLTATEEPTPTVRSEIKKYNQIFLLKTFPPSDVLSQPFESTQSSDDLLYCPELSSHIAKLREDTFCSIFVTKVFTILIVLVSQSVKCEY